MDEIVREAILQADQTAAEYERWRYESERRRQIIQKDFGAAPDLITASPTATLDQQTSDSWNSWFNRSFDDRINQVVRQVVKIIGEETGKVVAKQTDILRRELDDLRTKNRILQTTVTELSAQLEQHRAYWYPGWVGKIKMTALNDDDEAALKNATVCVDLANAVKAAQQHDPIAAARAMVMMAATLVDGNPVGRAIVGQEMARAAMRLDPHVANATLHWQ
jgi:hypothetical protein